MARILILEPHLDVRNLLAHVVRSAGHEPVLETTDGDPDAVVVEPASPPLRAAARRLVEKRPGTPVVCVSIGPPSASSSALAPAVHLIKPFSLGELKQALAVALG